MQATQPRVCVLDYGSGNVGSVYNLIRALQVEVVVSNAISAIRDASHLVLPGVGAYGAAMRKIGESLPREELERDVLERGKPFLGICVGMQVLATSGLEFGDQPGLGWIAGTVRPLRAARLPLPHVGWNEIEWQQRNELTSGLENVPDFYFLHSYAFFPDDPSTIAAKTSYGEEFCAVVRSKNIVGVQFHPEKSQRAGMTLLRNFLSLS